MVYQPACPALGMSPGRLLNTEPGPGPARALESWGPGAADFCRGPAASWRGRGSRIGTISAQLPWPHTLSSAYCVWTGGDAESCEAQSKPGGARLCTKEKDREVSRYQETVDETHAEIRINSSGYSAMKRHEPQIRSSASCCVNEARLKRLHTL